MNRFHVLAIVVILILPVLAYAHGYGHVMGTIEKFENDTLTLTTKDGETVNVKLTEATEIVKGEADGSREDIVGGSRVVVHFAKDKTAAKVQLPAGQ